MSDENPPKPTGQPQLTWDGDLTQELILGWISRAANLISQQRAELNALNVFPVPDADTGSNMAHTLAAAVAAAKASSQPDLARAMAHGAVRGARGNSGMVLSQIIRAIADSAAGGSLDGPGFAAALRQAVSLVEAAIAQPVEGTILSVLRTAAEHASEHSSSTAAAVQAALAGAEAALELTPTQLPVLARANVVDAGGAGLVIVFHSLVAELAGAEPADHAPLPDSGSELEVVFYFSGDLDALAADLAPLGNSLIIARDGTTDSGDANGSVHIHSRRAGAVIELAFARGQVTDLRIEALPATRQLVVGVDNRAVAALFAQGGARAVLFEEAAAAVAPGDIYLSTAPADQIPESESRGDIRGEIIDAGSVVGAIAAVSVYDPEDSNTQRVRAAMVEAIGSMKVARPQEGTTGELLRCCHDLLRSGGEQVLILSEQSLDAAALSRQLGVEVTAWRVSGIATEVGVE